MSIEDSIVVDLVLSGDFEPEEVTKLVGLTPSETRRRGESIQKTALKYLKDGWEFGLAEKETFPFHPVLCDLLDKVEPYAEKLAEACRRFHLAMEISCGIYITAGTADFVIDVDTLKRIVRLGADLYIDMIPIEGGY